MKRVLTAVVLIPFVLLAVLRAPAPLFAFLVAVVALLTASEFLQITTHYQLQPFPRTTYVLIVLLFVGVALQSSKTPLVSVAAMMYAVGFAAVIGAFILLVVGMRSTDLRTAFPGAAASAFAIIYVALPFALLAQLRQQWAGAILILYLLIVVWAGDTAAYYAGRLFGRHKLAPRISPGKTWEGTIASFVVSVAVGTWFFSSAKAVSLALLRAHLIDQGQGFFAPQPPRSAHAADSERSNQYRGAAWRSRRVAHQARRRCQGLGRAASRTWGHARPRGRAALCSSGAVVLFGFACPRLLVADSQAFIGMKRIAILGSTGSIGRSTLNIVESYPDRFAVTSLAAGSNLELIFEQTLPLETWTSICCA